MKSWGVKEAALKDDKPRIIQALSEIPGVNRVLPAWPGDWAELPCIVICEASNLPADWRDDRERITELEYYVRVFAARAAELSSAASAADDIMQGLGYSRGMAWEDDSAEVRQKVMRYRTYL